MFIKRRIIMLKKTKSEFGRLAITIALLFVTSIAAQEIEVNTVKGDVKYLSGTSEIWTEVNKGQALQMDGYISTGKKSSIQVTHSGNIITIGELSAVSISSIKKMTTDELLLALAMEDMINAPKSNGKSNSGNTAVYGEKEGKEKSTDLSANDFGIKRLNGAKQLAENGLKESGIIFAKETYRKYPETKQLASYRIYFADILFEKGLYTEALGEYLEIQKLDLNKEQFVKVEAQIDHINKILLNN
jgi:hypothetical protein